jgi:uncharacterized membrane protein
MNFLNPLLLFAGLTVIAPILIHLVRKEDARKVPFSSLMFITRMPKKSWRKQRLRHLLLLMLRITALLLLVLAFARPFFTWRVSPPIPTSQTRSLVVLLDNSFSMRFGDRFEKAKNHALQLVSGLSGGDTAQIVVFSDTSLVLNSPETERGTIQTLIRGLQPSYRSTNYAQALKLAGQLLASAANERREIHWISDFQHTGWNDAQQDFTLDQTVNVQPYDVAGSDLGNAAVSQVQVNEIRSAESPLVKVRARVSSFSLKTPVPAVLKLEINGKLLQEKQLSLEQNDSQEVEFEPFNQPPAVSTGHVALACADPLSLDNIFNFVLTQRKAQKLLLLGEGRGPNSLYLSKALAGSLDSPFTVDVQDIRSNSPFDLSPYAAVIINNVPMMPPQWASTLHEFLNNGGGVVFLAGDRVNPNDLKGPIEKVLPASVTGRYKADSLKKELFIGEIEKQHPIFSVFGAVHYSYFLSTPFSGYLQSTPHEASHVLARLEDGSPLLIEEAVGKGRSLLFTSSLNMDWNDLPLKSIFLPFCQQLVKHSVKFEENPNAFAIGDVIPLGKLNPLFDKLLNKIPNGAESFSQFWKVQKPSGEEVELNDRDVFRSPFFTLEEPGFYQTTVRNFKNWVAVNVESGESDLRKVEPQKLLSAIRRDIKGPQSQKETLSDSADQRLAWEAQQRLWWFLSLLALAVLLVESFLANRYHKSMLDL